MICCRLKKCEALKKHLKGREIWHFLKGKIKKTGRNLFLAAGGKIKCSKRLLGVLQTMSVAGGKYEILL